MLLMVKWSSTVEPCLFHCQQATKIWLQWKVVFLLKNFWLDQGDFSVSDTLGQTHNTKVFFMITDWAVGDEAV